jgi:very-long-chain (3R)-3-hydroxyacyl-CoA dehydratase
MIPRSTAATLYPVVEDALKGVQTLACMEVLHAAVGMVPASAATTFIQVFSRIFVLWGITHMAPPAQVSTAFALMCGSWASVEVPRYTYLLLNLWNAVPGALLWLRYSLFAVLYPTGITGEMWSIYSALDFVGAKGVLSTALPNAYNLLFNYHGFLIFTLAAIYPLGGYYMYGHMVRQRAKKLSPPKPKCE